MKLIVREINAYIRELCTEGGKVLGTFEIDVDGYFYFWKNRSLTGCDTSYILRSIADKLDEVNKEWDEHLKTTYD